MLNNDSIQLLQSVTAITNSVLISYPVTTITNEAKDVLGNIDFSKVDSEGWEEFGIYDLNSFLGAIAILENPVIKREGPSVIANDVDSSISFVVSDVSTMEAFTTDPENITSTCATESVVEISIDTDLINKIRKGVKVFKNLEDLFIVKEGDSIFLRTGNKESFTRTSNRYEIKLDPTVSSGPDFEITLLVNNFLLLPAMNYDMKIKYNPEYDLYRVTMENSIYQFVLSLVV